MLRAHFLLRMGNIDGFYYIRRRHKNALTVAPETGFGTPLRTRLRDMWAADFDAVRSGQLTLEASCLSPVHTQVSHSITEWVEEPA
jgi:hypothetical protein